jgi:hypothetical protein
MLADGASGDHDQQATSDSVGNRRDIDTGALVRIVGRPLSLRHHISIAAGLIG